MDRSGCELRYRLVCRQPAPNKRLMRLEFGLQSTGRVSHLFVRVRSGAVSLVAGSTYLEQATHEYQRNVDTVERPQADVAGIL